MRSSSAKTQTYRARLAQKVTLDDKLDPMFPVVINRGPGFTQLWEEEAWKGFEPEAMTPNCLKLLPNRTFLLCTPKVIDNICNDEVEEVSTVSVTFSKLSRLNFLQPKIRQPKISSVGFLVAGSVEVFVFTE